MSDQDSRVKRSKRQFSDLIKAERQYCISKSKGSPPKNLGRYVKTRAMNCGNPNCVMCGNPRKIWGASTLKEQSFDEVNLTELSPDSE